MHVRVNTLMSCAAFAVFGLWHAGTARALSAGNLQFASSAYSVSENAGSLSIAVTRTGGSGGAASVHYATANGTASHGVSYGQTSGILNWSSGDAATKTFAVRILAPSAYSGTRSFSVSLTSPTGASLTSPATTSVSIIGSANSNGTASVALSSSAVTIASTATAVTITAQRSGKTTAASTVSYATHDGTAIAGSNYTAKTGSLSWSAGDTSTKSISVPILKASFTGSKNFTVQLSAGSGAALGSPSTESVAITGSSAPGGGTGPAATLAAKLGTASRLLLGLGEQGASDPISLVHSLNVKPDIYSRYLGSGDWTAWDAPPCDYVCVIYQAADSIGAIPMYTQYQMANSGDGNTSVINDQAFMTIYWQRLRLLYQDLGKYGKPALVNLEPDFWGYMQRASNGDPSKLAAKVSINADCSSQPNTVTGVAQCMIAMARKYAPKAYVGLPPSAWGGANDASVIAFMNALGAQRADFIVQQTSDRDAGCYEAGLSYCPSISAGAYWDESNKTHPNFTDHFNSVRSYHTGIGNLPVIWWQTPEGAPSGTPGGSPAHFRDNRVHYFLTHPSELTAVGGLAVVFSTGEGHQTTIATDGSQYQSLSSQYLASPAKLP